MTCVRSPRWRGRVAICCRCSSIVPRIVRGPRSRTSTESGIGLVIISCGGRLRNSSGTMIERSASRAPRLTKPQSADRERDRAELQQPVVDDLADDRLAQADASRACFIGLRSAPAQIAKSCCSVLRSVPASRSRMMRPSRTSETLPLLLRHDHDDGVGLLGEADGGAVARAERLRDVRIPGQRQEAAGGGDSAVLNDHRTVVDRRRRRERPTAGARG